MAKVTVQAGRCLCVDEKPFAVITRSSRSEDEYKDPTTSHYPVILDAFTHYVAQKIDWNEFQQFLKEYKKKP